MISCMFQIAVACLVVAALVAYANERWVRLPGTIGVMAVAMLLSLVQLGLERMGFDSLHAMEVRFVRSIDFGMVLMQGLLSLLLFAGALHIDVSLLRRYRWQVGVLAFVGTVVSTAVVGLAMWAVLPLLGIALPFGYCLLFGALISPTDPIAVIAILRSVGAPDTVEMVVSGESLFNDGVGVVLFTLLFGFAVGGQTPGIAPTAQMFLQEAVGGLALGTLLGAAMVWMLGRIDNYKVEVLLTVAGVLGGYELAQALHMSGPLAMVMAGLVVGHQGRRLSLSDISRQHLGLFWELLDEMLNAVLFVLLGLQVVVVEFDRATLLATALAVLVTLAARFIAVGLPVRMLPDWFRLPRGAWKVLTWGGLRGGIPVALVLALPAGPRRELLLAMTYGVVVFSILVQGLTIKAVVRRALDAPD